MCFPQGPQTFVNTIENLAYITLAQTRRLRPLLNSSRLEEAGLCCCKVFLSIAQIALDLLEITVINAIAKSANVI
jgi:hypothetical protein